MRTKLFAAVFMSGVFTASNALADPPTIAPGEIVLRENGRTVHTATGVIHVHGERQQPFAFALSGRSPLGYSRATPSPSFVRSVVGSVRRAPF